MTDTSSMEMGDQAPTTSAGRITWALMLIGVVLVVIGGAAWWLQGSTTPTPQTAQDPVPSVAPPPGQEVVDAVPPPREQQVQTEPGAPERLEVPALGIDAPVVPIAAPGGVLTPPADPQMLGWWADGAKPGALRGSALVTGHTVSAGGGAMDDLEDLERGDQVWMHTDRGRIGYDVRTVVILGKGVLAEQAPQLFDQEVSGRLVLITCEDWNGVDYLSNVVVTATPSA